MRHFLAFIYILILLTTAACTVINQPIQSSNITPQPTAAVLAELPTSLPTSPPITMTIPTTPTQPTAVPPTATPLPTSTPVIIAEINITSPKTNSTAELGGTLTVSGRGIAYPNHTIEVALLSLDDQLITAAPTQLNDLDVWQVNLPLPTVIAGQAILVANLFSDSGDLLASDRTPIILTSTTNDERYLLLQRPGINTTAVAGYSLFFDGIAERPTDFLIEIALRNGPNCQNEISKQNFAMRGSGYWQAFFQIPEDALGTACAIAFFGDPQTDGRREVQLPVNILGRTDPNAYALFLAYPPNNSTAVGGQRISLYGTAYNAPNNQLLITLLLPDGTLAASEVATVDRSGYWEHSLLLPVGVTGEALLTTSIGRTDTPLAEQTIFLNLVEE